MTTIYNLLAGPGAGKSTSAAYIYSQLKAMGKSVELVREYVKDWAYQGRQIDKYDQIYIASKQIRSESLLFNKVDYIITDSPVLLGVYYTQRYTTKRLADGVSAMARAFYEQSQNDGHKHRFIYLKRTKPYVQNGRYQNEIEAKEIDTDVAKLCAEWNILPTHSGTTEKELNSLISKMVHENTACNVCGLLGCPGHGMV